MVMEPKYLSEEVIVNPNHPLTRYIIGSLGPINAGRYYILEKTHVFSSIFFDMDWNIFLQLTWKLLKFYITDWALKLESKTYAWWKKSCTTWDLKDPVNDININYLFTGAGFLPSPVGKNMKSKLLREAGHCCESAWCVAWPAEAWANEEAITAMKI